ncbi:flagellar basal body rod protein FlgC [Reinekea marina]|uniref:Flagellar basal-body rod protein FlgC n=1 Tax=Reinekea marina TaxID=1310421 RepID=A0ABV7WT02_9GAMM|nr:flagellar basal body rod protein FlgC [Reinekea marina]MBU2862925.1 flagellar basal body rod protein FlgC [Reinekea forsetii]MDN3649216.1 flagellar basal body rod protein FlgC [Reinekea marina]
MSLGNIFDISGSGMNAQSIRLNTTASNLANAQSVSSSIEDTYRARKPVFQQLHASYVDRDLVPVDLAHDVGSGVKVQAIVEKQDPLDIRFDPTHPMADEDGYVYYPNVNVVEEMADMMSASRSFTVNVEVFNTAKTLMQKTLTLGK